MRIDLIMPALNEAPSIGNALRRVPPWVRTTIVADNGSMDETAKIAETLGATVVHEPRRGYGAACLAAMSRLGPDPPDVVVFMDADGSDLPEEMELLIQPICEGRADLVIGSRVLGNAQLGSLSVPQRFGNALASFLIRRVWNVPCTDLGPFRAIRYQSLRDLAMDDLDYGWTAQMQARAARQRLRVVEVPVSYRRRTGRSKISGTVRGVLGAGVKILTTIVAEARCRPGGKNRRSNRRLSISQRRTRLIIFSRVPKAGITKTRLIPALGEQGAAQVHAAMTSHTIDIARQWRRRLRNKGEIEIRFTGGTAEEMAYHFATDGHVQFVDQGDGDLGDRLKRALDAAFADGADHAIAIGCDCPDLTSDLIDEASARLGGRDLVIGPAHDGGYYLIGMKCPRRPRQCRGDTLFRDIDWGRDRVFAQTLRNAELNDLSVATLIELGDVDEPHDLPRWYGVMQRNEGLAQQPLVSIIIPAINEAGRIADTIAAARQAPNVEIIVVDAGSDDETAELAASLGAHVIRCSRSEGGRAEQMNLGAKHAQSDVLLFLHADTRLPFGYLADVERVKEASEPIALAFRFAFDVVSLSLGLIERGANLRSRWLGLPYGDQGLVIRRDTFKRHGGFAALPVMEDYEFIRRFRKSGRVWISRRAALTSARRWIRHGVWRTTWRHQIAIVAYTLGVSIDRIAAFLGRSGGGDIDQVKPAPAMEKENRAYAGAGNR